MKSHNDIIAGIAREHLGIPQLEEQPATPFNFHSISVTSIRAALEAAFAAGAGLRVEHSSADIRAPFDAYEIHGIVEYRGHDGTRYCEQAPDGEAQFWSLFGHIPGQGLECIGDFTSREQAAEVLARITGQSVDVE